MHFPIYHDQVNRKHFLVMQNAVHLYRWNKSNDQKQMFLVVFCDKIQEEKELIIKEIKSIKQSRNSHKSKKGWARQSLLQR